MDVIGKYQGITVLHEKKELFEYYTAGSDYTRVFGVPTKVSGLITGKITSIDSLGKAVQCYEFEIKIRKPLPKSEKRD